jgi:hypothetical protein
MTLGGVTAGLITKFLDRGEDKTADAGWAALNCLTGAIDRQARAVPSLGDEPRRLIGESKAGVASVASLAQSLWGDHNVQSVAGSTITINAPQLIPESKR